MKLNLQKVTLRKLLEESNTDFFSKLIPEFFTGINKQVYNKIELFYKANTRLPSSIEFLSSHKDETIQDYLEQNLFVESNTITDINNEFLINQLRDFYVREETISFLDTFLTELPDLEQSEITEKFQDHLLLLNKSITNSEELFDAGEIDFFPKPDDFKLFSSGLSTEYDTANGGFGTQELILIGGRRGSGKSIVVLNAARHRFEQNNTVAFFSIEMRYKEVHDRLLSQISGVPFLDIYKNILTDKQKWQIAKSKFDSFYKPSERINDLLFDLETKKNYDKFSEVLKREKLELKDHRLFIIDDPSLTINRIDHYCNTFQSKYPDFTMSIVDYLNIIKHDEQKDWKTQIAMADNLKLIARKRDLTVVSPYQIDSSGEARFAKGILDSADRSFTFMPADTKGEVENKLEMHTTKIRNGRAMSFEVGMDWACTRVISENSKVLNEKALPAEKYGSESATDVQP